MHLHRGAYLTAVIKAKKHALIVFALCSLCWGCAGPLGGAGDETVPTLSVAEQLRLQTLLNAAEDAFAKDHLGLPAQGSALQLFRSALRIDPSNPAAQRGLEQIVERYLALAIDAAKQGNSSSAQSMLERGSSIDPVHPSIAPATEFVAAMDKSARKTVIVQGLSPAGLSRTIDRLLIDISVTCRFVIAAANDARARELYQALRAGFQRNQYQRRPRAATMISTPERLERVCNYESE